MAHEDPAYNPYAHNGPSSPLAKTVTVLGVIFAAILAGWYAWQGWSMAQQDCLSMSRPDEGIVAEFSLSWTPPFTQCNVAVPTQTA
ncbi:hypothetical protein [Jonesia quinghaiensis]|uniref:hypothetical protein n=1 Tax=Jonesia quinghaiensis TaxID=262806 RepID=UPI0003F7BA3D|nr:hypothetical protein [Jonesia quinghaiensis]